MLKEFNFKRLKIKCIFNRYIKLTIDKEKIKLKTGNELKKIHPNLEHKHLSTLS